jgi:hypothetical protein
MGCQSLGRIVALKLIMICKILMNEPFSEDPPIAHVNHATAIYRGRNVFVKPDGSFYERVIFLGAHGNGAVKFQGTDIIIQGLLRKILSLQKLLSGSFLNASPFEGTVGIELYFKRYIYLHPRNNLRTRETIITGQIPSERDDLN